MKIVCILSCSCNEVVHSFGLAINYVVFVFLVKNKVILYDFVVIYILGIVDDEGFTFP